MCQDHAGRWHAEGVLPDEKIAGHYLVKFPRGKTASDRQLRKHEAAYMRVATQLGLKIHASKTPNHARNTSILRNPSNTITLAPMYDFAPMYMDPEGVPRSCRWANNQEHAGQPD